MILTAITAFTYPIVIQFKRKGVWSILAPAAAIVWLIDVIANYLEWSIIFGWPARGDHTITARIRTMHNDAFFARRDFARLVQVYLDACELDGKH